MKNFWANKKIKIVCIAVAAVLLLGFLTSAVCNIIVCTSADKYVLSLEDACKLTEVDCIIVLGAKVREDGSLSSVLQDRVDMGAELYLNGASERILVSGDHSKPNYDEANAMKKSLVNMGIPADDIFTDHAGLDTYDTMYRARDVFCAKKVIIVTQDFHIDRAVFIARSLGLDAYGVISDSENRYFNIKTEIREYFARTKYAFSALFKPKPTYLGEAIPIWGEASASNG